MAHAIAQAGPNNISQAAHSGLPWRRAWEWRTPWRSSEHRLLSLVKISSVEGECDPELVQEMAQGRENGARYSVALWRRLGLII